MSARHVHDVSSIPFSLDPLPGRAARARDGAARSLSLLPSGRRSLKLGHSSRADCARRGVRLVQQAFVATLTHQTIVPANVDAAAVGCGRADPLEFPVVGVGGLLGHGRGGSGRVCLKRVHGGRGEVAGGPGSRVHGRVVPLAAAAVRVG